LDLGDFTGINQHGFKKAHSTSTAILQLQNEIATSLDDGLYHAIISLDLSAAFDMVNPKMLVDRMRTAGLPNDVILLVENWLSGRSAYVEFGGESSMLFNVTEGTVQGSVLGPILFAIFISPMFDIANVNSYADDSYLSEKHHDLGELTTNIAIKSNILTNWFKDSGLVVNENKTEFCVFHKSKKTTCEIVINDVIIKSRSTLKTLGVTFDENLTWENHIQNVEKNCNKINMGFRILREHFNQDELVCLMTSLYFSKMYYAAETWLSPNMPVKLQKRLMSLSAKILKTVSGIKCDQTDGVSYLELHKKLNRATPLMMATYFQATCLHRVLTNEVPQPIYLDLLVNHIDQRRHYKPAFSKTNKTRIGENVFRNRIQKTTNLLTFDMTTLNYTQFKIKAKRDLLSFN